MEEKDDGNSVKVEEFSFGPWNITVQKSHILQSRCMSQKSETSVPCSDSSCDYCRYEKQIKLPQLPEMTFPNNSLKVLHMEGFGIEFSCLEALQCIDDKNDLKVAVASAWQEARAENSHIKDSLKPFDWTFTTSYKGTLCGPQDVLEITETTEQINTEKLKTKEPILFYNEVILFEDELADNGTAQCSVKIRVMPSSFFILLRYFLRVDNHFVRINDTRVYHEANKNYILREYASKENMISNMQVHPSLFSNPSELWNHLPLVKTSVEKIQFPG